MTQPKNSLFRAYSSADREACLEIFDANCPTFFAPNERDDFVTFLDARSVGYEVCVVNERVVGAFGLFGNGRQTKSLNWLLIDPHSQGIGIGSAIMDRIVSSGRHSGLRLLSIAASHKSAPFFSRFGAVTTAVVDDGWGPGMNRVDMELYL